MSRPEADLALDARVEGGPDRFAFHTADGLASPDRFRSAELLLLETLWEEDLGRLLVPAANYGVVGVVLAAAADAVQMTETSARAVRHCERNVAANGVTADVSLVARVADVNGRFDTAAYAPREYTPLAVGKQRIADALVRLEPGARLALAARPAAGLGRYEACLDELATDVRTVRERDGYRVVTARRPGRFDPPDYVERKRLTPTVDGTDLTLVSEAGLFAASALDRGTRLLLEAVALDEERVLDLCCGYGAMGTYAALAGDCQVWLSDDCRRATACAEAGLAGSGVDGTVVTADCLAGVADEAFEAVLCNPPTHAGDGVLTALFGDAPSALVPGGRLVAVHHEGVDLRRHLDHLGDVRTLATGAEHVVVEARP